jgi:hypothetical protein
VLNGLLACAALFMAAGAAWAQTILPGVLDLRLEQESWIATDCFSPTETITAQATTCVVVAAEAADQTLRAYVTQMHAKGFTDGGALGNGMWLDRATTADCVQRVYIVGRDYPIHADSDSSYASLIFLLGSGDICGGERATAG